MHRVSLLLLIVCATGCAADSTLPQLEVHELPLEQSKSWRPDPNFPRCPSDTTHSFFPKCYSISPDPEKFVRDYLIGEYELHGRDVKVEGISFRGGYPIHTVLEVSFFGDRVMHLTLYELPLGDEMDSKIEGKSHLQLALESAAREIYERYRRRFPRQ